MANPCSNATDSEPTAMTVPAPRRKPPPLPTESVRPSATGPVFADSSPIDDGWVLTAEVGISGDRAPAARLDEDVSPELILAEVIDLNTATIEQLVELPGVGPSIAQRIIAWREKHGGYRKVGDLEKVRGIGPKTVARFADRVAVIV